MEAMIKEAAHAESHALHMEAAGHHGTAAALYAMATDRWRRARRGCRLPSLSGMLADGMSSDDVRAAMDRWDGELDGLSDAVLRCIKAEHRCAISAADTTGAVRAKLEARRNQLLAPGEAPQATVEMEDVRGNAWSVPRDRCVVILESSTVYVKGTNYCILLSDEEAARVDAEVGPGKTTGGEALTRPLSTSQQASDIHTKDKGD